MVCFFYNCGVFLHKTWKCANCFQFSSHAFRVYSALVHTNIPRELYGQKSGLVLNITLGCLNISTISPCNTSTFSKDPCRLETKVSCIIWFIVLQSTQKKVPFAEVHPSNALRVALRCFHWGAQHEGVAGQQ